MGMTIDKVIKKLLWFEDYNEDTYCGGDRIQDKYGDWYYKVNEDDFEAFREAAGYLKKYQQLQADYENRLKADMATMMEDLKQDFISEAYGIEMDCTDYVVNVADIDKIIQQKINSLKEDTP